MDWGALSRLYPEAAILIIAGVLGLKALLIFKSIVEKIDQQHHDALDKLTASINKNTKSNQELIRASREQTAASKEVHLFMQKLNGRLPRITKEAIKQHDGE